MAVVAACQASAGQAVRLRQRLELEYLTPSLACLRVATIKAATRSLVRLDPKDPTRYTVITRLGPQSAPFYDGDSFRGIQSFEGQRRRISVLDAQGNPVREIVAQTPIRLLGDRGYVVLPSGYDMAQRKPVDLRFFDNAGKEQGRLAKAGFVTHHQAAAADGTLVLIIGPADGGSDNRFLRLSSQGTVNVDVAIVGCRGAGGAYGLTLAASHAVFACFPGPANQPVIEPTERLAVAVDTDGRVTRLPIPDGCGTLPVPLGGGAVAFLGGTVDRVLDLRAGAWTPVRLRFSGVTSRPHAIVDGGALVVLVLRQDRLAIDRIDLATGRRIEITPLPPQTSVGAGRVFHRTPTGIIAVFKRHLFEVERPKGDTR